MKGLFSKIQVPAKIIELDTLADGDEIQSGLQEVSGMRTVPQVFVGGALVGGCDGMLCMIWRSVFVDFAYLYVFNGMMQIPWQRTKMVDW